MPNVGIKWEKQFHYLVSKGLKSNHKFVDIGCGALRLGQYLILIFKPVKIILGSIYLRS